MSLFWKLTGLGAAPLGLATALAFRPVAPPAGFVLQGTVAAPDGAKVYLARTGTTSTTDSTTVKGGHFAFRGQVSEPTWANLRLPASKRYAGFFLENHPMTLTLPAESQAPPVVTGSATQTVYEEYAVQWRQITQKAGPIYEMLQKATPPGQKEADPATRKEADARFAALSEETKQVSTAFVRAHPNSVAAAFVIDSRFVQYPDVPTATQLYQQLQPAAKASYWGKAIGTYLTLSAKTALGATPEFAQADTTGKLVRLSDFRGKYVLVDFWASWCGPCRQENPNVVALYQRYHGQGFEVLGVSLDSKKAPWQKAIKADGLAWTHVSDLKGWKNAVALDYGIAAVPQNFLVDPQGKIIAKNLRGEELQTKLAQVFAAK